MYHGAWDRHLRHPGADVAWVKLRRHGPPVGVGAAIIPVPVLVSCFLRLDRYEPEPIRYLALCLAWGACVATAVALLLNEGSLALVNSLHLSRTLVAVVGAPIAAGSTRAPGPLLPFPVPPQAVSRAVGGAAP